jgi:diacylglycerol kinase family enzyme/membrane-associated phospholipid phosphatase
MRGRPRTPDLGWGGVQRRIRTLVPAPVRRADLWAFRSLARARIPLLGPALPWLSRAANHARLWTGIALLLTAFGGRFGRRAALRGMLAVVVTSGLTNLPAKLLAGRTRPDLTVVPEVRRLARVPSSTSFPSGHAASAAAFATGVALERPELRAPMAGLAGAVAISRIYTGVHYPGDVVVGAGIGYAVARWTVHRWPLADDTPASGGEVDGGSAASDRYVDADGKGLVVVANVAAGNVLSEGPERELRRELPGARIEEAGPDEDLPGVLRRAAETARVLGVAGGDGSASLAADVAAEAGIPLLVIPAGTLNHLAGDLGIETIDDAVRAVRQGEVVRMDLGEVEGRGFVNAASIGAYPHLVDDREDLEDRIGKWPAALWSLLRILVTHQPTVVTVDGRTRRIWLMFVGNGRFAAEGLAPTRRRRLDDGCLDVRLVDAQRPGSRTRVFAASVTGRLGHCADYHRWATEHLEVTSDGGGLQLAADGETWRGPGRVTFRVRPGALMVLQPPTEPPRRR